MIYSGKLSIVGSGVVNLENKSGWQSIDSIEIGTHVLRDVKATRFLADRLEVGETVDLALAGDILVGFRKSDGKAIYEKLSTLGFGAMRTSFLRAMISTFAAMVGFFIIPVIGAIILPGLVFWFYRAKAARAQQELMALKS